MTPLVAGNWKMNGLRAAGGALAGELAACARQSPPPCAVVVCPPAQLLVPIGAALEGSPIALGGQDCHRAEAGAHTGDISAQMLADVGCRYVILGHSERRSEHGESSISVSQKADAACAAGLIPILCVGETAEERSAGHALQVIEQQIRQSLPQSGGEMALVVAYEPVWAIGSGQRAEPEDIVDAHGHIRGLLAALVGSETSLATPLLYGGSVKPDNAHELFVLPDVDGALVGGASLKAEDFWSVVEKMPE